MRFGKVPPAFCNGQRLYVAGTAESCRIKRHLSDKKELYCEHVHTLKDLETYYSSDAPADACPKCGARNKCGHAVPAHFARKCGIVKMNNDCYVCHVKSAFAQRRPEMMAIGQGWDWDKIWDWDPLDFLNPREDILEDAKQEYEELKLENDEFDLIDEANMIIAMQQMKLEGAMDTTLSLEEKKTVESFLSDIEIEHLPPIDILFQIIHELDDPADIRAFWKIVILWYNRREARLNIDARTFYILYTEILRATFPLTDDNYVRKTFPFMFADSELFSKVLIKGESPDRIVPMNLTGRLRAKTIRNLDWPKDYKAAFKMKAMDADWKYYVYSANKPIVLFEMTKYLRKWLASTIIINKKQRTIKSLVLEAFERIRVIYSINVILLVSMLDDVKLITDIAGSQPNILYPDSLIFADFGKSEKTGHLNDAYNIFDCVIYSRAINVVNEPNFCHHRGLFDVELTRDNIDALFRVAKQSFSAAKESTMLLMLRCLTCSNVPRPALDEPILTSRHESLIKEYMEIVVAETHKQQPAVFFVLYKLWLEFQWSMFVEQEVEEEME